MGVDSWFKFSIEPQRHRESKGVVGRALVSMSFSLCLCVSVVPFLTSTLNETHGSLYTGAARAAMPVDPPPPPTPLPLFERERGGLLGAASSTRRMLPWK